MNGPLKCHFLLLVYWFGDHVWVPDFPAFLVNSQFLGIKSTPFSVVFSCFSHFCWLNPHLSPFFWGGPSVTCCHLDRRRHGHPHLPIGGDLWRWHRWGLQSADAAGIYAVAGRSRAAGMKMGEETGWNLVFFMFLFVSYQQWDVQWHSYHMLSFCGLRVGPNFIAL